jgi:hypothetical protein
MSRLNDLQHFYDILAILEYKVGGTRTLLNCNGHMDWPQRGVYFFFEPGENRTNSGTGFRVVRVGTHALITNSQKTLWNRLHQHQGTMKDGGGNHRGSIFRSHVGSALLNKLEWSEEIRTTWGIGTTATGNIILKEKPLEQEVSRYIRNMPFLWHEVNDAPGPESLRGVIERNSISLISNYNATENPIDSPSANWLGHWATNDMIRLSGLWNVKHIAESYDPHFLDILEKNVITANSTNPNF